MEEYPRIVIKFCTKCRWNLRAAWYLQELLSTFGTDLGEVALQPGTDGVFIVSMKVNQGDERVLWDRKVEGRFPESKELKRLVRDVIDPSRDLGHVDRAKPSKNDNSECTDCKD